MSTQRKFTASVFFDAFQSHEIELATLFIMFNRPLPTPFTTAAACQAVLENSAPEDGLTPLLYQLNDLATPHGRDIIEAAANSHAVQGEILGVDVTTARAALRLWHADKAAFEHAMDRLAVTGVQGGKVALFPGRAAMPVADPAAAVAGFESQLNQNLKEWKGALGFNVRHYLDGTTLVILVFCERTAEVHWEFDHGNQTVKPGIRRPVIQDVLFYDQSTGELEIEASHAKHREILRSAFAVGVLGDDSFFPEEESSRVLRLQTLVGRDFRLPTRQGHTASITGIRIKDSFLRKHVTMGFSTNRQDVVEYLRGKEAMGIFGGCSVTSVRIDLILGPARLDRKSIELSGHNGIKFNRSSHVDTVHQYLRAWSLMEPQDMADESAA